MWTLLKTSIFVIILLISCKIKDENTSKSETSERYPILLNMVHHNPGEPHFESEYTQPEYIKSLGYTGQVPKIEIQCGLTYDDFEDNIIPEKSAEKMWIQRHAASIKTRIDIAEKYNVPVYPFTDVLVVPQSVLKKYEDEMSIDGKLSIKKEMTQKLLKAQIAEIFKRFPEVDGLTIRHGETYLHDTPFHRGTSPATTPEEHSILINLLRDEICVKRNKKLIYRTWDFSQFHTKPEFYLKATNAVEPHDNLIFSIKHVNNDFLRGNPFNKTIGLGKHQQIVEISTNQAGIYGRNSHPYYIGKGVIEGWSEMKENKKGLQDLYTDEKIKGFWTWTWGDGWVGPYFNNELWIKLNEYMVREFALHPKKSEEDIFYDYALNHLKLSESDAEKFRKLCLLSTDAVYYGQATQYGWTNPWYVRDHYLAGIDLQDIVKNDFTEKVLAEKEHYIKDWYEIEKLSKQINLPNVVDDEFLKVSASYGRIKYEIIEQVWRIQILLAKHKLNKGFDVTEARGAIKLYNGKWQEWVALKKSSPLCPTLYVDYEVMHIPWFQPFQESLNKLKSIIDAN